MKRVVSRARELKRPFGLAAVCMIYKTAFRRFFLTILLQTNSSTPASLPAHLLFS